jgi:hypothetical protein
MQCKDRVQNDTASGRCGNHCVLRGDIQESLAKARVTGTDGAKLLKTADRFPHLSLVDFLPTPELTQSSFPLLFAIIHIRNSVGQKPCR